ncbi:MAG: hypothetical protein IJ222_06740 [Bacteroidales bacterium]|nr:hypothetical protein [Bacteroidales bacterium]
MASRSIPIYLTKNLLDYIAVFSEEFPILFELFAKHASFIIDMEDHELDAALADSDSDLSKFQCGYDIDIRADKVFFSTVKHNPGILTKKSRTLCFLDMDEASAVAIGQEYGVIVHSSSVEKDFNPFAASYKKSLIKGIPIKGVNGWQILASEMELSPRNTIIISDRYLFTNDFATSGYENLVSCLKSLMPGSFKGSFHVLITSFYPNIDQKKLNILFGFLCTELRSSFNYDIKIELFVAPQNSELVIHKRRVFLGYQTINCDKGFNLFADRDDHNKPRDDNEFIVTPAFIPNNLGDSQFYIDSLDLERITKLCKEIGKRYSGKLSSHNSDTVLVAGDFNKQEFVPNNRLLNK